MAKSSLQGAQAYVVDEDIGTNDPEYTTFLATLIGDRAFSMSNLTDEGSYARISTVMPFSGSIRRLTVKVMVNERITATTFTVLVDNQATNCTVVYDPSETGIKTSTGSAVFSYGQRVALQITAPTQDEEDPDYVGDTFRFIGVLCEVVSDTDLFYNYTNGPLHTGWTDNLFQGAIVVARNGDNLSGDRDFWPYHICGAGDDDVTQRAYEPDEQGGPPPWTDPPDPPAINDETELLSPARVRFKASGDFVYHEVTLVDDATSPHDDLYEQADMYLSVAGVDGGNSVAIDVSTNGWARHNQSTTIVPVASGDYVAGFLRLPADLELTVTTYMRRMIPSFWFRSDDAQYDVFLIGRLTTGPNAEIIPPSSLTGTRYLSLFGTQSFSSLNTDLDWVQFPIPVCTTFSNLRIKVSEYTGSPATFTLMKDGVATALTVTVNGNGYFEDTASTVTFECNEEACYRMAVPSGTFTAYIEFLATTQEVEEECVCAECECSTECAGDLTVCDLKDRVYGLLGEDSAAPAYWTDTEIVQYISDSYIEASRESGALELIEAIELAADSEAGVLSARVGGVMRATFDDRKIDNTTKMALDRTEPDWENQSGFVSHYVTTLHDTREISTFKAWDGGSNDLAYEHFYSDAYTYSAWALNEGYADGDRVTRLGTDGITRGYVCTVAHTSAAATEPGTGASWETKWVPLVLCVWAKKIPDAIEECDVPELPGWFHMALAFRAASLALSKYGEMRHTETAAAYMAIYEDYLRVLKGFVSNRTPGKTTGIGRGWSRGIRRPQPYDRVIEAS